MKYLLILSLTFNAAYAQTWPTADCKDVPYIKGIDDYTIHHTGNCGVVILTTDSIVKTKYVTETKYVTKTKYVQQIKYVPVVKTIIVERPKIPADSAAYCPMCGKVKTEFHIICRVRVGYLYYNKEGYVRLTPLGEYMSRQSEDYDTDNVPIELRKYFPPGYFKNKNRYELPLAID